MPELDFRIGRQRLRRFDAGCEDSREESQHRSSRTVKAQHLQLTLLFSRSLLWQRPTTRDKLQDLISFVRKSKVACISELSFAGGERVSSVFIKKHMFILTESTGIRLDPMCRVAFQNGVSTLQSEKKGH